ncbi:MAG: YicC family protein [Clostridia bacterium]|nr:YicC family protein [Clostridia bacterium]
MIRSMTGFGRAVKEFDGINITAEIKSVNHRYFEFSCRMPRAYQYLEDGLKQLCKQSITRGKAELSIMIENKTDQSITFEVDEVYAKAYVSALKNIAKTCKIKDDIKASSLVGNTDIFKTRHTEIDEETITAAVNETVLEAIKSFIAMREVEGEKLKEDVLKRADFILEKVSFIESQTPETVKAYRERLEEKIKELLGDAKVDEQRLITETAIFADKVAVDEETVRLRSHIKQLNNLLSLNEPVGKKLDFIVQEMNRETNTIGSKSQNIEIAHTVVDIKSEIEKIREQIQNIE